MRKWKLFKSKHEADSLVVAMTVSAETMHVTLAADAKVIIMYSHSTDTNFVYEVFNMYTLVTQT